MRILSSTLLMIAVVAGLSVTVAGCSGGSPEPTTTVTKTAITSPKSTPSTETVPSSASSPTCGPIDVNDAAARAIVDLPIPAGLEGAQWDPAGADISGYAPCAALSWLTISVTGATADSPVAILLFHDGVYVGTATKEQYAFVPDITRTGDDAIKVSYQFAKPGEAMAAATGHTEATFTWDNSTRRVKMAGHVPPGG